MQWLLHYACEGLSGSRLTKISVKGIVKSRFSWQHGGEWWGWGYLRNDKYLFQKVGCDVSLAGHVSPQQLSVITWLFHELEDFPVFIPVLYASSSHTNFPVKLYFLLKKKADIPRDHEEWKELSRELDVIWAPSRSPLWLCDMGRSLNLYEAVSSSVKWK